MSASVPTASRELLPAFHFQATSLGLDADALFYEVGLPRPSVDGDDFPEHLLFQLCRDLTAKADNPAAAWQSGACLDLHRLGGIGKALGQALSLHELLRMMEEDLPEYASHAEFWRYRNADGLWLCRAGMRSLPLFDEGRWEAEHWTVNFLIALVRLSAGENWWPQRVTLQGPNLGDDIQDEFLPGAEVAYGRDWTGILLPESALHTPLVARNGKGSVLPALRRAIRECLLGRNDREAPTLEWAAERCRFSVRTLQRRLADQGLDFRRLLDQVRFDASFELLQRSEMPVAEIAAQLDYADPAHFSRAFRRWSGATPSAFRD